MSTGCDFEDSGVKFNPHFFGTEAETSSLAPWLPQYHRVFSKDPYEIIHKFSWEVVHPLVTTATNQGFHHCSLWLKLVMKDAFF